MQRRGIKAVVLGILLGGLVGAALSHLLQSAIRPSPVRNFFFNSYRIGFSPLALNLGFMNLTIGFFLGLSIFTVAFIILVALLFYKL